MTDDYEQRYQAYMERSKDLKQWTYLCMFFCGFDLVMGWYIAGAVHSFLGVLFAGSRVWLWKRWRREQ